ncbi:MAG: protein kinase [Myxococcales bacterium]|nr:protein kinase [Myxococcales bacterium]
MVKQGARRTSTGTVSTEDGLDGPTFTTSGMRGADETGSAASRPNPPRRVLAEPVTLRERFRLGETLGQGGMGIVYAAHDTALNRKVAVKVLHDARSRQPQARARLIREAQAMARVSHPNIVQIFDVGEVDGQIHVIMEFVDGVTLGQFVGGRTGRPGSWRELVEIYCLAGDGLAAAHEAGIVHRDFKPTNVLVDGAQRPRVTDFGLASSKATLEPCHAAGQDADVTLTTSGALIGTPAYMAPEQFEGQAADAHSDQFSFCVSLWEALHKRRPFTGSTLAELSGEVLAGELPAAGMDGVPAELDRVLLRGLARIPEERYPTLDALLARLRAEVRGPRGRRWPLLLSGLAALVLVGGLALNAVNVRVPDDLAPASASTPALIEPLTPTLAKVERLTRTPGIGVQYFALDPAGTKLLYKTNEGLWMRAIDKGIPERVETPIPNDGAIFGPRGEGLMVLSEGGLWHLKGDERELVLDGIGQVYNMQLSPDGTRLATTTRRSFQLWDLERRALLHTGEGLDAKPAWSPDSAYLALVWWDKIPDGELAILDREGRLQARVELAHRRSSGVAWLAPDRLAVGGDGADGEGRITCHSLDRASAQLRELEGGIVSPALDEEDRLFINWALSGSSVLGTMTNQQHDILLIPLAEGAGEPRRLSPEGGIWNARPAWRNSSE